MSVLPKSRPQLRWPMWFGATLVVATTLVVSLSAFGWLNGVGNFASKAGAQPPNGDELQSVAVAPQLETPEPEPSPTRVIAFGVEDAQAPQPTPASASNPVARASQRAAIASGNFKIFIPVALSDYTPPPAPPRQVSPFAVLGPYSTNDWPATSPEWVSKSRISVHALGTGDPYTMEFIRRAKPRVVKAAGDYGWLREVKEVSPYIVTQGRIYGQDEGWVNVLDPTEAAEIYVTERLEQYRLNPFVDYWEGWNEFVYDSPDKLRWFAQFEAARACKMWERGYRAAVGGFSVGWPNTYPEMELFLPALEAAYRCGGIFHLHEYNKPLMMCGVQTNVAGLIPGAPALRVPAGPLTLRYRFWYEGYLRPRGLADLPLIISETGIDGVPAIACPDPPNTRMWKDLHDWWVQNGYGADGANAYVSQLAWFDRELQQDNYVIGATIFTVGA
ncbi:MAG: hypothetical protein ACT4QE_05740, partial [Anaerolineales bacterium]